MYPNPPNLKLQNLNPEPQVSILSSDISNTVEAVREGNFPVPEKNHTVLIGWNRQTIQVLHQVMGGVHRGAWVGCMGVHGLHVRFEQGVAWAGCMMLHVIAWGCMGRVCWGERGCSSAETGKRFKSCSRCIS